MQNIFQETFKMVSLISLLLGLLRIKKLCSMYEIFEHKLAQFSPNTMWVNVWKNEKWIQPILNLKPIKIQFIFISTQGTVCQLMSHDPLKLKHRQHISLFHSSYLTLACSTVIHNTAFYSWCLLWLFKHGMPQEMHELHQAFFILYVPY